MGRFFFRPDGKPGPQRPARALAAAKILLACLLLVILTHSGAFAPGAILHLREPVGALAIALICVLTALGLGVYRWLLVLAAAGIRLPYFHALRLYWVGAFASTLLPGAVSGDLLRAAIIARETPGARTLAATSVVVDRAIGLLGFALCGLVLFLVRFDALRDSAELRRMALILALVVTAAAALVLAGRQGVRWIAHARARRRPGAGPESTPEGGHGARSWSGRVSLTGLLAVGGISLAIPLLLTAALLPFLPEPPQPFAHLVEIGIASIAAQVANTLPLTPGGIGIGEGVFEYVAALQRPGVMGYATAFLSLRLVTIAVNAAGGLFLLVPGTPLRAVLRAPVPHGAPP